MNQMRMSSRTASLRSRIVGIDQQVPVLGGGRLPYVNLDNAASTPVLREVLDTVNRFMDWYSSVHRGAGFKSQVSTHAYEEARGIAADFVGARRIAPLEVLAGFEHPPRYAASSNFVTQIHA